MFFCRESCYYRGEEATKEAEASAQKTAKDETCLEVAVADETKANQATTVRAAEQSLAFVKTCNTHCIRPVIITCVARPSDVIRLCYHVCDTNHKSDNADLLNCITKVEKKAKQAFKN